jgi:hypothetical protein
MGHRQGHVGDRRRHADRLLNIRGDHSEQNALVLAVKGHADRRTKRQQLTQDRELIVPVWKRRKADATRVVYDNIDAASRTSAFAGSTDRASPCRSVVR